MSIFVCTECHQHRDADDGCEDLGKGLVCIDCLCEAADAETSPEDVERHKERFASAFKDTFGGFLP